MVEGQQIGALQAKVEALEKSLDAAKAEYARREDELDGRIRDLERLRANGKLVFRIVLWVGGGLTFVVTQWRSIVEFFGVLK